MHYLSTKSVCTVLVENSGSDALAHNDVLTHPYVYFLLNEPPLKNRQVCNTYTVEEATPDLRKGVLPNVRERIHRFWGSLQEKFVPYPFTQLALYT